jgi:hypothetical protein
MLTQLAGVYIGGLLVLHHATGQKTYIREAEAAAASAMETTEWTDGEGMITEFKHATINSDGMGFRSTTPLYSPIIKITNGRSSCPAQEPDQALHYDPQRGRKT